MEIFGVQLHDLALYAAGLIAAVWGGSKVPWQAAIAKLLAMLSTKSTDGGGQAELVTLDVLDDPGAEFMAAMHDLHRLAHTPEEHARLGQFTADWWSAQQSAAIAKQG